MEEASVCENVTIYRGKISNFSFPFCICYDIISIRTNTFKERLYICEETAVKQRGKY